MQLLTLDLAAIDRRHHKNSLKVMASIKGLVNELQ